MECVKAQRVVRPYLDGLLSERELEEFLDHVESCPSCFGELEIYFSIDRTLNNVDEKGDYNYANKLREKIRQSRAYLRKRARNKAIKLALIVVAECGVFAALWGLMNFPGGYIERHKVEMVTVSDTEAADFNGELVAAPEDETGEKNATAAELTG